MFEIIVAIGVGIVFGIITGLTPGIHINLVSVLLVSSSSYFLGFTEPITLAVFIIAMGVTHTFLDAIPSIFLGAPDESQILNVLPGHRLLLRGMGYEAVKLTVIGSLMGLLITILLLTILMPLSIIIFTGLQNVVGYILVAVSVFMILKERGLNRKFWAFLVFMLSGILGVLVLTMPDISQPLFPLLSGLFGVATLLDSLTQNVSLPKQRVTEMITPERSGMLKAFGGAVFSGSLTGLFPGLGSAHAAIIAMQFLGNIGMYSFMILIGGISTVNFLFSLVTFYTIDKARNGGIVAIQEIVGSIDFSQFMLLVAVSLVAGGIATFLALLFSRGFAAIVSKVNYKHLSLTIMLLIGILAVVFDGLTGLLILAASTAIGLIPPHVQVKRSMAMGVLLLPVILFFLL